MATQLKVKHREKISICLEDTKRDTRSRKYT